MKRRVSCVYMLSLLCSHLFAGDEIVLEKGWSFTKGDFPKAISTNFDDSKWEQVVVPHDWAIYGPFDKSIDMQKVAIVQNGETIPTEKTGRTGSLPYIGVGWYRTTVKVPKGTAYASLLFDGAMSDAKVYVNGKDAGYWPYGYNAFEVNMTPFLNKEGEENTVAVRLENMPQSSRWYPGAGLYRPVTLLLKGEVHIPNWGISVTTPKVNKEMAYVRVQTELVNAKAKSLSVKTIIRMLNTTFPTQEGTIVSSNESVAMMNDNFHEALIKIANPKLWSPETPELYEVIVIISDPNSKQEIDRSTTRFGIRSVEIDPKRGFVLNGEPRKFKGVCLHHDLGPIGAAINKAALRRQLQIMKDMGCDAIRTAHNMPSTWQMELCDEMGLMVMAESFDEWKGAKCKNGYNRFFTEWAEKDMVNLIRCHRNHPSIVMWSIGNEVPEQGWATNGNRTARFLQDICHREDPTRPVTVGMDQIDNAIKNNFAGQMDVVGINYRLPRYENAWKVLPQGLILGSETASTVSSRGVYKFPVAEVKNKTYNDGQCSSYDVEACSWSNIPEDDFILQDEQDWVIGEFVWTGFDYLGEPTPYDEYWPSRSSYFGIVDLAGIPKDRYYLYRSRWNTDEKTLHVLPHWNWKGREGEVTPVYCYTNYPEAELFVNGVSQGKLKKNPAIREDRYRLRWNNVVYQPGNLKVVAYDEHGKAVAEQEVHTAGNPVRLLLEADRSQLEASGNDLAFVTVKAVDKQGNFCPIANNSLRFEVKGEGNYRAACNGDATSIEEFHKPTMKLFNGQLVVLIQTTEKAGKIELTVSGKGFKNSTLHLESK